MRLRESILELSDQILQAAAANGAHNVRIFGSVARGEERDKSDIDLLIALDPGRTLFDLIRLETRLERLLGRSVDVVTESGLREPFRSEILREAIDVG